MSVSGSRWIDRHEKGQCGVCVRGGKEEGEGDGAGRPGNMSRRHGLTRHLMMSNIKADRTTDDETSLLLIPHAE